MIKEDYVSFETAKLLKEKGFDIPSIKPEEWAFCMYNEEGKLQWGCYSDKWYCRITLQLAMKWLREEHHLHIFTVPRWEDVEYMPGEWEEQMIGYQYVILDIGSTNRKINQPITTALSPESSYEAAIRYVLKNLI